MGGNTAVGDKNLVSTHNNADNLRPSSPQLRLLPYNPDTPVKPQGKNMRGQEGNCGHRSSFGKTQGSRPRTTIIRFTNRSTRDLLWRRAKNCEFLIKQIWRFTEFLTSADKVTWEKLWPTVAAA
ncbi:unnamed protein product [Coregonus sp. 'balchen']|nr:unnamed protein product [Coregonus sp. 'balchen']